MCSTPLTANLAALHHITWWRNGGPTDLDNLTLLCTRHHHAIHHHGWDIQLGPDHKPEFLPPPWIDPDRTPRRNPIPQYHKTRNKSPS